MIRTGILALSLSAALLPLACSSSSTSAISDAKEKIGDAADAVAVAAKAKRDEFVNDMQKKLDELDVKLKALEKSAADAKGDAKKDLDEKVKVAKAKRDAAGKKLDAVKDASHDRWEKVKDGFGSAYDDLKKIFE